jgi:hypothetical protein
VLEPKRGYTEAQKEQILSAYHERSSMRGVERTFGISRPTLIPWLKKNETNPKLEDTLLPAEPEDVLGADEMWSFVYEKWNKPGFGRSCAVAHAKLWFLSLVIGVKQPAASFGSKFHKRTKVAKVTAISGKPINSSFL